MDEQYTPIGCSYYDQLELLAMHKSPTVLKYRDDQQAEQELHAVIVDVYSQDKQEFIKLDDGQTIRLDRLISVDRKPFPAPTKRAGE